MSEAARVLAELAKRLHQRFIDHIKLRKLTAPYLPKPERDAALARVAELEVMLNNAIGILAHSGAESGWCMCGDKVEGHNIGSGHSPVDAHVYAASHFVEEARALLEGAKP